MSEKPKHMMLHFVRKIPHKWIIWSLVALLVATLFAIFNEANKSGKTMSQVVSDAVSGTTSVFGGLLRKVVIGFGLAIGAAFALATAPAWMMALAGIVVLGATGAYTVSAGLLHLPELPSIGGSSSSSSSSSGTSNPDPCVTGPYTDAAGVVHACINGSTGGGAWQG